MDDPPSPLENTVPAPDPRAARLLELGLRDEPDPAPAQIPPLDDLAALFVDFELLAPLGQGGMGIVYKARQRRLDRLVALKIVNPGLASDPTFEERFEREARALARLDHPGIITVHDFGEAEGLFYLVMEYVDGTDLRRMIRDGVDSRRALAIVPQICDALQYAHDRGVVHRDIKPENILVDAQGRVRLADFGLAKLHDADPGDLTLTGSRHVLGTPQYMAPEQIQTPQDVDHRADIYALGVVLYEMLTGELPLGRFPPPSEAGDLGAGVDELVLRSLERDRELRYQHVHEVKSQVERLPRAVPPTRPPRAARPRGGRRRRAARWGLHPVALAVAVVLLGVPLVGLLLMDEEQVAPAETTAQTALADGDLPDPWGVRHLPMGAGAVLAIDTKRLWTDPEVSAAMGHLAALLPEACSAEALRATDKLTIAVLPSVDFAVEAAAQGRWTQAQFEGCARSVLGDGPQLGWTGDGLALVSTRPDLEDRWVDARLESTHGLQGDLRGLLAQVDADAPVLFAAKAIGGPGSPQRTVASLDVGSELTAQIVLLFATEQEAAEAQAVESPGWIALAEKLSATSEEAVEGRALKIRLTAPLDRVVELATPMLERARDTELEVVHVGIEACDRYIETYTRCIEEIAPQYGRKAALIGVHSSARAWKANADGPARETIEASCLLAIATAKQATQHLGCDWGDAPNSLPEPPPAPPPPPSTGDALPKPPTPPKPPKPPTLPKLDKRHIAKGMAKVKKKVLACSIGVPIKVRVKATVNAEGAVLAVKPLGRLAGLPVAKCVAGAVRTHARFARMQLGIQIVEYTFQL